MKNSIRRLSLVSMFVLSSFTVSLVTYVPNAQALVGVAVWPCFVLGAALEAAALGSAAVALLEDSFDHHRNAMDWTVVSLTEFFLGLVMLDNPTGTPVFQELTEEQGLKIYGLSPEELQSYNHAVVVGDMQRLAQQAEYNFSRINKPTAKDAKKVMHTLLEELPSEARSAFVKIAVKLSLSKK